MRNLIDSLFNYTTIGTQHPNIEDVNCNSVLQGVLQDLRTLIEQKCATVDILDSLPNLRGDRSQLAQLFQNLISNALKFGGKEPTRIEVGCRSQGENWVLSIKDNGIGMDMKYALKIFDPFKKLHSREEFEGCGLGLAVCKKLAELQGGSIWVESAVNRGSTFFVSPPRS
jgi:light-regulated signal transduction histidine kinase (bacteriophytochrome)